MDGMRKSTPSICAGIWISVHISASRIGIQDGDGFRGIDRLERRVPSVLDHIDSAHAQHHLVLDNENDGWNA